MSYRDPYDLADLALDDYYAGRADPPPGHPDAYDEQLAEREYAHRYALADEPCPLNVPHRQPDDWELGMAA